MTGPPPPINYATHPTRSAVASPTSKRVAQPTSDVQPTRSAVSSPTSRRVTQSASDTHLSRSAVSSPTSRRVAQPASDTHLNLSAVTSPTFRRTVQPARTAQPVSEATPASPSSRIPGSGPVAIIAIDPDWLQGLTRSTLRASPYAPITQRAPSITDEYNSTFDSLTDLFDGLSTEDTQSQGSAADQPPAPPTQPTLPPFVPAFALPVPNRRTNSKFYSVTVGKRCGVFDRWSYVQPLVIGVSQSCYISFKTYNDAAEDYAAAKAANLVMVVRDLGDELIFGPLSMAIM